MEIKKYNYDKQGHTQLCRDNSKSSNWPVVYLITNDKKIYIGETTSVETRMSQHLNNKEKNKYKFKDFSVVFDDEFNKSVILDYEQRLIKCFNTDNKYTIVNKNLGQSASHNYYQREEKYEDKFVKLWKMICDKKLANNSFNKIINEDIFKYSPYNALTEEQEKVCIGIIEDLCNQLEGKHRTTELVEGCAGTGKTVLAISIINSILLAARLDEFALTEDEQNSPKIIALKRLKKILTGREELKIGLIFPMTGIRKTIKKVFKDSSGLKAKMVIGPHALKKEKYDVLIVDEAHRLKRNLNLGQTSKAFKQVCNELNLDEKVHNQLDWVMKQSEFNVLFYDENQSIKSTDISNKQFVETIERYNNKKNTYKLTTQMRCLGGDEYINYLQDVLSCNAVEKQSIENYDFRIFDDVSEMTNLIKKLDNEIGLCRTVAGYSWEWKTNPNKKNSLYKKYDYERIKNSGGYDIDIKGNKYIWNLTTEDWITSQNSVDTIGCIHTVQGFDLNYVGVIFGQEIDYDIENNSIVVDINKFCDRNVKNGCTEEVVKKFIINTYYTMMARGIRGCFVYAYNENLNEYLKKFINENSLN